MRSPCVSTLRREVLLSVVVLLAVGAAGAQVPSRNVNMVSGVEWPGGDPFLQRQNEPSVAVSTRNPMHLLAGANDYRTVDLPGLPDDRMTGDAWPGVFTSTDGGATWKSTLVPGYPQEPNSTSPLHGLDAGADPIVRSGPHGLFYYAGIVFDRTNPVIEARRRAEEHGHAAGVSDTSTSVVFVARYIDNNVKENGNPIAYLGTSIVAKNDYYSDPGVFLDKPWLAVDMPRLGAGTCTITQTLGGKTVTQTLSAGNVYLAYSQFTGKASDGSSLGKLMLSRSTNCGATWSAPIAISGTNHVNQGATIALDPRTGTVYVAWRRFAWPLKSTTPTERDAILIARSLDRGKTFSAPEVVKEFQPFDQPTFEEYQFRTSAYPTAGVDRAGRVLLAWSARGVQQPNGDARIVLTWARYPSRLRALFSSDDDDGTEAAKTGDARPAWTTPAPVDPDLTHRGHQIMPSMLVTGLRVQIAWVDLQQDNTWGVYTRDPGTGQWQETRPRPQSDERSSSPSHVFNPRINDTDVHTRRHSADIWVAQADPGDRLGFTLRRASDYRAGTREDDRDLVQQLQFNPPNLPIFKKGTASFWGDYIDLAAQPLEQKAPRRWRFALQPPSTHVVFTDNRDVRAPTNGDWSDYTPPRSPALQAESLFAPGTATPTCTTAHPENAGMRNQNIYTARVSQGLYVAAPGNAKPLGRIQRAFVVYAENGTLATKTFRMSIASQPTGGSASFRQFARLSQLDVTIGPRSSASRTVYVGSTDPRAPVTVDVREVSGGVVVPPAAGGLQGAAVLNPDSTNPDMMNPDMMNTDVLSAEIYTPDMMNPDMMNPDMMNPDMMNPDMMNPDMMNPDMMNPGVINPDMMNPDMMNAGPDVNASILNPDMMNPDMMNSDLVAGALTDTVWTLTNNGNTTAAYDVELVLRNGAQPPAGFKTQLLLYKTYLTPVAKDCQLVQETQNVLIASIPGPRFVAGAPVPSDPADGSLKHATLWLAPGESAKVALRVLDPNRSDAVRFDPASAVVPAALPQAVDTVSAAHGVTQPSPATPTTPLISFHQAPSSTPVGRVVAPPVTVWLRDDSGAGMAGATVTLSVLSGPTGATLHGATSTTGVDGRATFASLWLDEVGTYQLRATAAGVAVDSAPFDVVALPGGFTHVSAGAYYTCGVRVDGTVACWGESGSSASTPPSGTFTRLSASGNHTCGVRSDGTVACWGDDSRGQSSPPPGTFTQVSAGGWHTCGLKIDGTVACWGGNDYGASTPPPGTFTQVSAGGPHNCGVKSDGIVACWGGNDHGESAPPTGSSFTQVGAGLYHTCGVRIDGTAACWGYNGLGQSAPPTSTLFTQVSGGIDHTCGLRTDGTVACWGDNSYGQSTPPVATFVLVSAGGYHTCGLKGDGTVACWGRNDYGQSTPPALGLAFIDAPGTATAGQAMPTVRVQALDAAAAPLAGVSVTMTLGTADCGSSTLSGGTTAVTGADGVASFSTLSLDRGGYGYALRASATGTPSVSALSGTFNVQGFCTTGSLAGQRVNTTATPLPDGTVLIAGGFTGANYLADAFVYDPATGAFTAAGSMATPRGAHAATLLTSGKVLITGGAGGEPVGLLSSAELYDPATRAFSAAGAMHSPRMFHTATALRDGKVLILGLVGGPDQAELYDPGSGTFAPIDPPSWPGASNPTATLLPDGRVLFVGGGTSSARLFDPVTVGFSSTGSMAVSRQNHTATLLPNGKVLVAGGWDGSQSVALLELYDPSTGSFSPSGAALGVSRDLHAASRLPNGKVLLAAGFNHPSGSPVGLAEIYDPVADRIVDTVSAVIPRDQPVAALLSNGTVLLACGSPPMAEIYFPTDPPFAVAGFEGAGTLLTPRLDNSATPLPDGNVLIAGGLSGGAPLDSAEVYDAVAGSFSLTDSLSTARWGHTATFLPDGRVLLAGGASAAGSHLDTGEIYDPASRTFSPTGTMSTRRALHTATLLPNGKVLVAGGIDSTGAVATPTAELYDPVTGVFSPAAGALLAPRARHTATLLPNGKVLIVGSDQSGVLASAELYDPATGTFAWTGSMSTARHSQAATPLSNGKVLVTGGWNGSTGVATTEIYDPALGTFSPAGDMNGARWAHTATALPNGSVLITGGEDTSGARVPNSELYDPPSGTFTLTGGSTTRRVGHQGTLLFNGKVLVTGGGDAPLFGTVELYRPGR
jgi:hypothetical protein